MLLRIGRRPNDDKTEWSTLMRDSPQEHGEPTMVDRYDSGRRRTTTLFDQPL